MDRTLGSEKNIIAYEFNSDEIGIIILGFKREISRLKKQYQHWKEHPKNEGQATYQMKTDQIARTIMTHQKSIEMLAADREKADRRKKKFCEN